MCKNAIGSDRNHLAEGINASVLFMIAMVFVVFAGFSFVVWASFRAGVKREKRGEVFAPEGKVRWQPGDGDGDR